MIHKIFHYRFNGTTLPNERHWKINTRLYYNLWSITVKHLLQKCFPNVDEVNQTRLKVTQAFFGH